MHQALGLKLWRKTALAIRAFTTQLEKWHGTQAPRSGAAEAWLFCVLGALLQNNEAARYRRWCLGVWAFGRSGL